MGNCISEYKVHMEFGRVEFNMEQEEYMQLSMLFTNDQFNHERKIPMEGYNHATCSYLHLAVKNNSLQFVRMWLRQGYPINVTDSRGWTALHWAVYYNTPKIFMLLILGGIDTEIKTTNTIKLKNKILKNKTAIEMIQQLNRHKILKQYNSYKRIYSNNNLPIYIPNNIVVDDEEDIPVANALSESYTISSIPTGREYKLIKKICNWEMYSDKYGNFMWKHSITGELLDRRPNELRKIVSISYYAR